MEAICKALKETSEYMFDWYEATNVREDSLTDWFLYNLKKQLPRQFYYHTFNRHEEGKVFGADFYLYILNNVECIALAVQAKKLMISGNHYTSLNYDGDGKQINMLIGTSNVLNHKPVYFFYNNIEELGACPSLPKTGIYFHDAERIRIMLIEKHFGLKKDISREELLSNSIGFHCPFCCFSDGATYNMDGLKELFLGQSQAGLLKIEDVPDYIIGLANGEFNEGWYNDILGQKKLNYRYITKSIVVLDLRKHNKI